MIYDFMKLRKYIATELLTSFPSLSLSRLLIFNYYIPRHDYAIYIPLQNILVSFKVCLVMFKLQVMLFKLFFKEKIKFNFH